MSEYAIKIYKTSILVFKDRDKYVAGEHRWRKGYCKSNPRKMVKVWAEKEMRNYRRLHTAGIPCPTPVLLKSHVLIMEFLGTNGWPSPRLKDAGLRERRMREAYVQTVVIMRRMFQRCRLVHGDLSEYNLLWHNNEIFVIDVSQSVESDHPSALDFLRKDAANVNDFFRKSGGLDVMTTRQLFEFVTSPLAEDTPEAESECLDRIMAHVEATSNRLENDTHESRLKASQQEAVDEAVFMSQFLPRSLNQVADHEIRQIEQGEVEDTYAHAVAALTGNRDVVNAVVAKSGKNDQFVSSILMNEPSKRDPNSDNNEDENNDGQSHPRDQFSTKKQAKDGDDYGVTDNQYDSENNNLDDVEEIDDESDDDDDDDDNDTDGFVKVARTAEQLQAEKEAIRAARKANKKAVREAKSDKRKQKIKKKDKKKAINKSKAGNKKKK